MVVTHWRYEVHQMTYGKARIVRTDGTFNEDNW